MMTDDVVKPVSSSAPNVESGLESGPESVLEAGSDSRAMSDTAQLVSAAMLGQWNRRSNAAGALRIGAHLTVMILSACVWGQAFGPVSIGWRMLGLVIYGSTLAFMFCPMHECVHRTAFANVRVNDAIAWLAGLLSFYNGTFYRRYHKWHHRYTRIEGKDPELSDLAAANFAEYLWVLSGIPWWKGKVIGHIKMALGQMEGCFYLSESSCASVMRSTRMQLGAYGAIALISLALGHPWFLFTYWLLPLAVGQPFLRFVLLAEHTGCSYDDNPLANTRTTLTLWPLRFLMWNMSYHAEHHLYPSIPFHALPSAHSELKSHFATVDPGYVWVNRKIVHDFS
jgi:fatty acid desaturase